MTNYDDVLVRLLNRSYLRFPATVFRVQDFYVLKNFCFLIVITKYFNITKFFNLRYLEKF